MLGKYSAMSQTHDAAALCQLGTDPDGHRTAPNVVGVLARSWMPEEPCRKRIGGVPRRATMSSQTPAERCARRIDEDFVLTPRRCAGAVEVHVRCSRILDTRRRAVRRRTRKTAADRRRPTVLVVLDSAIAASDLTRVVQACVAPP